MERFSTMFSAVGVASDAPTQGTASGHGDLAKRCPSSGGVIQPASYVKLYFPRSDRAVDGESLFNLDYMLNKAKQTRLMGIPNPELPTHITWYRN